MRRSRGAYAPQDFEDLRSSGMSSVTVCPHCGAILGQDFGCEDMEDYGGGVCPLCLTYLITFQADQSQAVRRW
jgi:hypothetical protein